MPVEGLNAEQQALFASIMGNSSQQQSLNTAVSQPVAPAASANDNPNRLLSQSEIDALIASMTQ